MFDIDKISYLLTVNTDCLISDIEKKLSLQNHTLGYFVPPDNQVSLKEALAQKLSNLYSLKYGKLPDLCVALGLKTKTGERVHTPIVPRQATGPSWKNLILGSKEHLGNIQQAVLKIFDLPELVAYTCITVSSLEETYLIEQNLSRRELIPRSFYRFEKSEGMYLLLEWADSANRIKVLLPQVAYLLEGQVKYQNQEGLNLEWEKLLRQEIPKIGWGGKIKMEEDKRVTDLQEQLFHVLGE